MLTFAMNQCWEWFAWYSSWEFVVYNWYQCPANHHAIIETTTCPPTAVSASDVYDYDQYNQYMYNYNQYMYGYYAEQSSHQNDYEAWVYSVNSSQPKWLLTLRWYVNDFWSRFWWVFIGGISWKLQQDVRNILNSILLLIRRCFCYFCRCPMNAYTLAINRLHQSGYTDNDMYTAWWHNPDGSSRPSSLWVKISTQSAALLQGSNRNHVMEFHNDTQCYMLRVLDFYSANHVRRTTPPLGPDMDGSLSFEPVPGRLPEEMQRMDAIPDIGAPEPLGDQHCCMLDDALGDSGPV